MAQKGIILWMKSGWSRFPANPDLDANRSAGLLGVFYVKGKNA